MDMELPKMWKKNIYATRGAGKIAGGRAYENTRGKHNVEREKMKIEIRGVTEVREDINDWMTIELNERDVRALEDGEVLGFESNSGKRYLIVPAGHED